MYSYQDEFDDDPYEELREALAPEYQDLAAEEITLLLAEQGISPEDAEFFGKAVKALGKVAAKAAPAVLGTAGTALGAFGGPVGAALGGAAGTAAGRLVSKHASKRAAGRPRARRPGRRTGRHTARRAGRPPARRRRQPAAAQLQQLLSRPQVLQALMAMALGRQGRRALPVGSAQLPVAAIANTIRELAGEAAAEYNASVAHSAEGVPTYLLDDYGEFLADPMDAHERAELVLAYFEEADWEQALAWEREVVEQWAYEASLAAEEDEVGWVEAYEDVEAFDEDDYDEDEEAYYDLLEGELDEDYDEPADVYEQILADEDDETLIDLLDGIYEEV